ncbi:MAG TPA: D-2-hydroxyacid dehydrogenase [Gemmatimonadaceae bacterium]|nr:D-2-hydroxyacid dehydrogenase [Gemmatimonadaceae bacterium]
MSSVLPVRRVVIGQNAHVALSAMIAAKRPDLELRGNTFTDVTADDLAWADAYIGFKRPPLPTMGSVRWVQCTGAGVDSWLQPVELPREIVLTRTPESFGPMIAEWALSRALAFVTKLGELGMAQREHRWTPPEIGMLRGSHAVVVGTGDVGTHVGRLFGALGCRVSGVSRTGLGDASVFGAMHTTAALRDVAATADWLILTLPLTPDTRGLVNESVLGACRGTVLINAGRGAVIDESILPRALAEGWLSGAALDVFEVEPLPETSPLWDDPRVMISPHVSGLTTLQGAADGFLECLATFERGETPRWVVDRDRGY